jgi:hypothetical protein
MVVVVRFRIGWKGGEGGCGEQVKHLLQCGVREAV